MYTEINNRIYDLREKLRIKEKLDSLKKMAEEELDKKKNQALELEKQLKKEEKDVVKLEGTSFSSIFLALIGKKDEKLDKEREEFLEAELRHEECIQSIIELEKELKEINNELSQYKGIRNDYKKLLKEKENLLLNDNSTKGKNLREKLDQINELKLEIKELKEAINAGNRAKSSLGDMRSELDKAKGWGVWDMLGGGLISNIAKHSAIDSANTIAHQAQYHLKSFQKELSDVNEYTDVSVDISGFTTFADFFFDGFFVDWFVQSKINNSYDKVDRTYNIIGSIVNNLENNLHSINGQLSTLNNEVKDLLEMK